MSSRRQFITLLGGMVAWPLAAWAQQPGRVYRVAIFSTTGRERVWHLHQALIDSLRSFGYIEGQNVLFENRFAEGKMERLAGIAAELGQRFLGSNHIRRPRQVCRAMCG
jgi:putative ABC transport system substrate-binding protein